MKGMVTLTLRSLPKRLTAGGVLLSGGKNRSEYGGPPLG